MTMVADHITHLIGEAHFLCNRLDELDWSMGPDDLANNFSGHVDPPLHRLKGLLDALPSSFALATDAWQRVGTFEPDPYADYLVMGTMFLSVKKGRDIDHDNIAAAKIRVP